MGRLLWVTQPLGHCPFAPLVGPILQAMDDAPLGFGQALRLEGAADRPASASSESPRSATAHAAQQQKQRSRRALLASEPVDKAVGRYTDALVANCVAARTSLDLFDQHWRSVLRNLAQEALDAMRS